MGNLLFDPIKVQSTIAREVIVGFSGGKDSIVTLDLCFKYFDRVVPFFMWVSPNLGFQEDFLKKYERRYKTEIIRLPHFEVSEFMKYGTFRNPDPNVSIISINDVYAYLRELTGIEWIAAGERMTDSLWRRGMIHSSGSTDAKRRRFYPLAHWKKNDVLHYIKQKRLHLPKSSRELGFSFRGLAGCELIKIKELYPEDYARILKLYPLAGAGVKRFEIYGK